MEAVVIFTDEAEHWLASRLRPGYRHVFCVVPSGRAPNMGTLVNLTTAGVYIEPVAGTPEDIANHYRDTCGLEVLLVPATPWKRQLLPTTTNSCVGLTKQAIGITSWALTPWQLRRHLAKELQTCGSISHFPASATAGAEEVERTNHRPHPQHLQHLRRRS